MLIDSHCHLTYDPLCTMVPELLERMSTAGVSHAISVGTSTADTARAAALAEHHAEIFATAGVHPHEAGKAEPGWEQAIAAAAGGSRMVAIGETGLDYHYDFSPRDVQRRVFEAQLEIAATLGKPVIIHCREAHADVMAVLATNAARVPRIVFHCFTGTAAEAREILDRGCWISLTGVVTFKGSAELRDVARFIPADRLMVETDSPYLSPEPYRSRRPNEPSLVVHTARRIAEVRGEDYDAFVATSRARTIAFFNLPIS